MKIVNIYSGRDKGCRCGCGGKYWNDLTSSPKSFNGMIRRIEKFIDANNLKPVIEEGLGNEFYFDIAKGENKVYTVYFLKKEQK